MSYQTDGLAMAITTILNDLANGDIQIRVADEVGTNGRSHKIISIEAVER